MARLNAAFLRALDANGDPVSGALLKIYQSGTSTPVDTFADAALSTMNAWPLVSDAEGRWPAVYLPAGAYKVRKETESAVLLQELDRVDAETNGYATRAAFVTDVAAGTAPAADGTVIFAGGVAYEKLAGATDISDLGGWIPYGDAQPQHFGAAADGVTDDQTAIGAAITYASAAKVVGQTVFDTADILEPDGRFYGEGNLVVNGNKSARFRSTVDAEPTRGTDEYIGRAFNGDMSECQFPVEHYILGVATLGQPTSGYVYTPEATPHYTNMYVTAGHNDSTTQNLGRTGATAYRTKIAHYGDGDAACYNGSVSVFGAKAGATGDRGWLANPAGVLLNGEVVAENDGVYLNVMEVNAKGSTYDCSGVGCVYNLERNDNTGALGAGWDGIRLQSKGTEEVDSGIRWTGGYRVGLNLCEMTSTTNAAIAIKAGHRIYLDAQNVGGSNDLFDVDLQDTHISCTTTGGPVAVVVNNETTLTVSDHGTTSVQVKGDATSYLAFGQSANTSYIQAFAGAGQSTVINFRTGNAGTMADRMTLTATGALDLVTSGTAQYRIEGTKVLGARITGWTAPTGTATRSGFATSTATTQQVAEALKALIDDLTTHGQIGA